MEKLSPTSRPRGKDEVQSALIQATARLIAQRGVSAVSTRAIAAEAGVNQGLITRYFGSKDVLVKQVAVDLANRLFAEGTNAASSLEELLLQDVPGRREGLRALIHIVLESSPGGWTDHDLSRRFFSWLRLNEPGLGNSDSELRSRVFLVATFVFGSELIAPSLREDLNLSEGEFQEVRKQAVASFLKGFSSR